MKKIVTGILVAGAVCMTVSAETKAAAPAAKGKINVNTQKLQDPFPFLPEVVAEFDGKKITKQEFMPFFASYLQNNKYPFQLAQLVAANAVKEYINMSILQSIPEKEGYKGSPAEVEKAMRENLAKLPEAERKKIEMTMQMQGTSIEKKIKEIAENKKAQEQVAYEAWFKAKVEPKIKKVTEADAKAFYEKNIKNFTTPADPADSFRTSHILIMVDQNDPDKAKWDKAKKKIDEIAAMLKKGDKFEELAAKYSQCGSSKNGGSIGMAKKDQLDPDYSKAALALKDGEISAPVKSAFGWHIIRRDKQQTKPTVVPFADLEKGIIAQMEMMEARKVISAIIKEETPKHKIQINVKQPDFGKMVGGMAPKKAGDAKACDAKDKACDSKEKSACCDKTLKKK